MGCADPVLCYILDSGKKVYRHFSMASDTLKLFHRNAKDPVFNCGKCLYCRKKKAYELASRCVLHASLYQDNNCFITLTYDETLHGYINLMDYTHIQNFKKKLRAFASRELGRRVDIFNVHEYGKNGKKHWHLIVFNWSPQVKRRIPSKGEHPLFTALELHKMWPYGHHSVGEVSEATAMYQAQYMEKDFKHSNVLTEKQSHSKHAGLARPYFEKHYKQILELGYVPINGRKLPIPRYFLKIAHRHWCHFNEPSAFYDTVNRKALYRPFKIGQENKEISNLFELHSIRSQEFKKELEKEWDEVITQYLETKEKPDFLKANENNLYDLKNKQQVERF